MNQIVTPEPVNGVLRFFITFRYFDGGLFDQVAHDAAMSVIEELQLHEKTP